MLKKPTEKFIDWCLEDIEDPSGVIDAHSIHEELRKKGKPADWKEVLISRFKKVYEADNTNYNIKLNNDANIEDEFVFDFDMSKDYRIFVNTFHVNKKICRIKIKGLNIKRFHLHLHTDEVREGDVRFENCRIHNLVIYKNDKLMKRVSLDIIDTEIGCISVSSNALQSFSMTNGGLLNIDCPRPGEDNPFSGNVVFKNVYLPNKTIDHFLRGPQAYRNMRHHLRSLENSQMANLFHTYELKVEKENDTLINNFINWDYWLFSGYGSSAFRPLMWLVIIVLVTVMLSYSTDGAELTYNPEIYSGWREVLTHNDAEGNRARSILLAVQSIINPAGIFGIKSLVIAKHGWLAVWTAFQSMFSVIFIALTIFSIRRRFKIQ